jgi:hypothetical protein
MVMAALTFTPVGKGAQLMKEMPWVARSLNIAKESRVLKRLAAGAKVAKRVVPKLKKAKAVEEGAEATERGAAELLSFTGGNFRENLARLTGVKPEGSQAHHIFPQKFRDLFNRSGINVDDPHYGAWWEQPIHGQASYQYNLDWQNLFRSNPSRDQILQFGREQARKYGFQVHF